MTPLQLLVLAGIAIPIAVIAALFSLHRSRSKESRAPVECEDYYDGSSMGVREVLTGNLHVFPLSLVQQIDIAVCTPIAPVLSVSVTAEFHRADFTFDEAAAEQFLVTMAPTLEGFDLADARSAVSRAFSSGSAATIYVSPHYSNEA